MKTSLKIIEFCNNLEKVSSDNEIEVLNLNNALLKGDHNHLNVLAAASVVKLLNVNTSVISV